MFSKIIIPLLMQFLYYISFIFFQDILKAKVKKIQDYSKCSNLLLRLLYKEEERQGRSLTGSAGNKKEPAKPALGQPEMLNVLYGK